MKRALLALALLCLAPHAEPNHLRERMVRVPGLYGFEAGPSAARLASMGLVLRDQHGGLVPHGATDIVVGHVSPAPGAYVVPGSVVSVMVVTKGGTHCGEMGFGWNWSPAGEDRPRGARK